MDPVQQFIHDFVHGKTTAQLLEHLSLPNYTFTPHGTLIPPNVANPFVDGLMEAGFSRQEAQAFYETLREAVLLRHTADLRMAADLLQDGVFDIEDFVHSSQAHGQPSVDNLPNSQHPNDWTHPPANYHPDGTPRPPEHLVPVDGAPHGGPHGPAAQPHNGGAPPPGGHGQPGEAFHANPDAPGAPHRPAGDIHAAPHGSGKPHIGYLDAALVIDGAIQDGGKLLGYENDGFVKPILDGSQLEALLHRIEAATPASSKLLSGIEHQYGHTAAAIAGVLVAEIQLAELVTTGGGKIGNAASEILFPAYVVEGLATLVVNIENLPQTLERLPAQLIQRIEQTPERIANQAEMMLNHAEAAITNLPQNTQNVVNQVEGFLDNHGVLTPTEIANNVLNPVGSFNSMVSRVEGWSIFGDG